MSAFEFIVYRIKNVVTGKMYFGSTTNFKKRSNEHFNGINRKNHINNYIAFDSIWCKKTDWDIKILSKHQSKKEMLEREQFLISIYAGRKICYNLRPHVSDEGCTVFFIAINLKNSQGMLYLTIHALSKDLKINKTQLINNLLRGFYLTQEWLIFDVNKIDGYINFIKIAKNENIIISESLNLSIHGALSMKMVKRVSNYPCYSLVLQNNFYSILFLLTKSSLSVSQLHEKIGAIRFNYLKINDIEIFINAGLIAQHSKYLDFSTEVSITDTGKIFAEYYRFRDSLI